MPFLDLATYKLLTGNTSNAQDGLYTRLLAVAKAYMESRGLFFDVGSTTEYFPLGKSGTIYLSRRPVTSITAVHVDAGRNYAASSLVPATEYLLKKGPSVLYGGSGGLFGIVESGRFLASSSGYPEAIRVQYNYGWSGSMPPMLQEAAIALVTMIEGETQSAGTELAREKIDDYFYAIESGGGASGGANSSSIYSIKKTLDRYCPPFVA